MEMELLISLDNKAFYATGVLEHHILSLESEGAEKNHTCYVILVTRCEMHTYSNSSFREKHRLLGYMD